MTRRNELREIEDAAREAGWTVSRTARGHVRFVPPDPNGKIVITAGSPSDIRGLRNLRAQLKRQGLAT